MNGEGHTLYAVGRIVKAFGIRGEVIVEPMTTDAERFHSLGKIFAGTTAGTAQPFTVAAVRTGGRGVRVQLAEVRDRTEAGRLAGAFLFVPEEDRVRPPEGTFFVDDVVGLTVVTGEGRTLGTVCEVLHMPAHDVYVVSGDGREIMIPAVKEFILGVDLAGRTMQVQLIDGMIE